MSHEKVTIEAVVNADIKKVWEYWNHPEHIVNWNFASDDWHCPRASNDLRPGGKLDVRMEAKDGSFGFDFEAIYDEILEYEKITYTMGDGRQSTSIFVDLGNHQTKVSTSFDAEHENPVEMQKAGWQAILNNFKKYAEEN